MYKRWEAEGHRRGLRDWLAALRRAKTWQLLVVLVLLGFASATFLRLNNLGMVGLRQKVETADKSGQAELTRQSLADLQHYASAHMNAYPGVIYLQESYNRDYAAAIAAAAGAHNPSSDVYQQASIACRERFRGGVDSFRNDYVNCVAAAVSNLPSAQQTAIQLPNPQAYRYSFSSPLVSFDFAGIGALLCLILALFIFVKITGAIALKFVLKRRNNVF